MVARTPESNLRLGKKAFSREEAWLGALEADFQTENGLEKKWDLIRLSI